MASKNTRTGKCTNFQNGCTTADSNKLVEVSILADFECPECGKELSEVQKKQAAPTGLIAGVAGVVAVAGLAAGSYFTQFPSFLYGGGDDVVESIEIVDEPQPEPEPQPQPTPEPTHGTVKFAYGTYVGDLKNGRASGQGKMTYTKSALISPHDRKKRYAEPGQYIIGTWYDNKLDMGKLYNSNGTLIEIIQIGRAE
ncbi:MAG: hypothetical protein SNG27_01655 [Rikenellaceae bacterium]